MEMKKRLTQREAVYHSNILVMLQAYENTGLTPHEIEMMKAGKLNRLPKTDVKAAVQQNVKYVLPKWFQSTMHQRRKCVGMSIEYLAELCGTSYATVRQMEKKEEYAVSEEVVCKVCNALGMTASWEQLQKEAEKYQGGRNREI